MPSSIWSEMSYNKKFDPWSVNDNDSDDEMTGMEVYFLSATFFDGADIVIREELVFSGEIIQIPTTE